MVHCEGGRDGDGEERRLCSRLLCHAHLYLTVDGMETGYCRDIHGEVCNHKHFNYYNIELLQDTIGTD